MLGYNASDSDSDDLKGHSLADLKLRGVLLVGWSYYLFSVVISCCITKLSGVTCTRIFIHLFIKIILEWQSSGSPPSSFRVPYDSFREQGDSSVTDNTDCFDVSAISGGMKETSSDLDYEFICFFLSMRRLDLYRSIDYRCEEMLLGHGLLSKMQTARRHLGLSSLEKINLSFTMISDGGLRKLSGFSSLKSLNLDACQITDFGLEALTSMHP
ncbi:hypothetical protein K1719_002362 [Acacia pycnantha]|nr:hypothetical protein K1719_002362 [Acacia pycnantha]